MALKEKQLKADEFGIRLSQVEQALIKQAAKLRRTTPTKFIREQAVVAAESVVHGHAQFVLTKEQWTVLESALNEPPRVLRGLKRRLAEVDAWDGE